MIVKRLGSVLAISCVMVAPAMSEQKAGVADVSAATETSLTIYQGRTLVRQLFNAMPDNQGQITVQGMASDWQDDSLELEYVSTGQNIVPERVWWHRGGLDRDRLYRRLVGKPVELLGGGLNVTVQGTMLSYDAGLALVQGSNGRQYLVDWHDPQGVRVASRDAVFLEKDYQSYLMASFSKKQPKNAQLRLSYITPSLSYSSHYRMILGPGNTATLELNALLTNNTDTDYSQSEIRLVSGDTGVGGLARKQFAVEAAAADANSQYGQRVGEILVTKLPSYVQLTERSSQQVSLYRKDQLKLEKVYTLDIYGRSYAGRSPALEKPRLTYRFKADADLPAGKVRIIEENPEGGALISGNAWVPQTTAGDYARLSMGEALAVRVERQRIDSQQGDNDIQSRWRAVVFNDRDESIVLQLTDRDRSLLKLEDVQGGTLEGVASIRITVPAGSQKQVGYTAIYSR
ncbi:MAG: hypothetical protein ACR2PT_07330 [Endozoicomonas sp.]